MNFGARAYIQLGALKHNLQIIRQQAPDAAIMAVVKANAYGHGLRVVASALDGVDAFAVARLPEALELRAAGIQQPIVLLSGVYSSDELQQAFDAKCELVVHCDEQVALLEACSKLQFAVWLKVDTGINRLGFPATKAKDLIQRLSAMPAVADLRLMTHLANADDRDDPETNTQLAAFADVAADFSGDISIANSGGLFGWPQAVKPDYLQGSGRVWVRPGIAMYGISPFPEQNGADLGLQPVMQFRSKLLAVKPLSKGSRVGYGGSWQAQDDTVIGIVSAGYGDGYTRYLPTGTPVRINGRSVPLVGAVSMDMAVVDLGLHSSDKVGDEVLLWGDELPIEEIARSANSNAYQLVCGIMHREASSVVD